MDDAPAEPITDLASGGMRPAHDLRGVLRVPAFRKLWIALSLSSLGDWLGLLATTALAQQLGKGFSGGLYAIGGVLIFRLLPAVVLGPFAGAFADRFDRRRTMVICDLIRFSLFVSIPLVHSLAYLLLASFLIEAVSLFWIPAKEATVPNLLPKERLEAANQLSLITTYGSAPFASLVFTLIALFNSALAAAIPFFSTNPTVLALYFDAATFLFSAATVFQLREIKGPHAAAAGSAVESPVGMVASIAEGWRFVGTNRLVRGLVVGMLGAFAAGGAVIGLGKAFVSLLGGGNAGYGVLFGAVFTGLALGMFLGPRLLHDFSRHRLFGLAIVGAGVALSILAVVPNLVLAVLVVLWLGSFAGVAWVTGYTLLGLEVADEIRGRTFALVQSLVRIDLLVVLAAAPFIAGSIRNHRVQIGQGSLRLDGITVTLFVSGLIAVGVGLLSYRQMDDRDTPLWRDLVAAVRGLPLVQRRAPGGVFVVLEGGEGAGKSTQAGLLRDWVTGLGREAVLTREPGATPTGARLRALLLDPDTRLSPRAEALLYAADRAEHVATVIAPALARGAVVISDRYIDSSLAYQGAGRDLAVEDVARVSRWATDGLVPNLTVLLDLPPADGLVRAANRAAGRAETADRLEREPTDFHERVRRGFRELAERDPGRYLVLDATLPPEQIFAQVRRRLEPLLTGPEAVTSELPAQPPTERLPVARP